MDKIDIEKQREIGKQLFLLNILHCENDKALKTGWSFLSRDKVASWASMTKEEVDHFIDLCAMLDPYNLDAEAARIICERDTYKSERNIYYFVLSTYYRMGDLVITSIEKDKFKQYCEKVSELNYQLFIKKYDDIPIDESYATSEVYEDMMSFFIQYFVAAIKEVISEGYDWDVIASMARVDITEERYKSLVNWCAEL